MAFHLDGHGAHLGQFAHGLDHGEGALPDDFASDVAAKLKLAVTWRRETGWFCCFLPLRISELVFSMPIRLPQVGMRSSIGALDTRAFFGLARPEPVRSG